MVGASIDPAEPGLPNRHAQRPVAIRLGLNHSKILSARIH